MDTSTSTPKRDPPNPPSSPPKAKEKRRSGSHTSINDVNDSLSKLNPPSAIKAKPSSVIDTSNDTVINTNIDFNRINNVTLQSIKDDIIKLGSHPKKGEPPPTCIAYTISDHSYTENDVTQEMTKLETSDNALSILDGIINKYPNQQMSSTKCAIAIITLQQQDLTQEQSRKLFNMLLRCKLCNKIDPRLEGSTTTIEVKDDGVDTTTTTHQVIKINKLIDIAITKLCQIMKKEDTSKSQLVLDYYSNSFILPERSVPCKGFMMNTAKELERKKSWQQALGYYLVVITVSNEADDDTKDACCGIARCAVGLEDKGLLMDTLRMVESCISSDSGEEYEEYEYHKMLILDTLLQLGGINILSSMSFHCSLMHSIARLSTSSPSSLIKDQERNDNIRNIIARANDLMKTWRGVVSNEETIFTLMNDCCLTSDIINAAREVCDDDKLDKNTLMGIAKDWIEIIKTTLTLTGTVEDNNEWFIKECKTIFERLQTCIESTKCSEDIKGKDEEGNEFISMNKGECYRANVGDGLDIDTINLLLKNWASPLCYTYVDPRGWKSKVARNNGCINAFLTYLVYIINNESGVEMSDVMLEAVNKGTVFVDRHITVVKSKKTVKQEHALFLRDSKVTGTQRNLIPGLSIVSHALLARMNGKHLRVGVASAEAWRDMCGGIDSCVTTLLVFLSYIPHGETYNTPKSHLSPASFTEPELETFCQKFVCLYTNFTSLRTSSLSNIVFTAAQRNIHVSKETHAQLIMLRLDACIRGGQNSIGLLGKNEKGQQIRAVNMGLEGGQIGGPISIGLLGKNEKGQQIRAVNMGLEGGQIGGPISIGLLGKNEKGQQIRAVNMGLESSQVFEEAINMLADGNTEQLSRNHLSLLLHMKVDEADVHVMRSLLSAIVAGEEPSQEQSDLLDGLDEAWDQKLEEMKRYKNNVFDLDAANTGKIFFVPGGGEYASLNAWLMPQVKLYEKDDWRNNDKHIIDILHGGRSASGTISELRKFILARRREKLCDEGVVFDVDAMESAARVKPKRVNNMLAARRAAMKKGSK